MATGFGSLGGLGSYTSAYPMRTNAPDSQTVVHDDELNTEYQKWLAQKQNSLGSMQNRDYASDLANRGYAQFQRMGGPADDPLSNRSVWEQAAQSYVQGGNPVAVGPDGGRYHVGNFFGNTLENMQQGDQAAIAAVQSEIAQRTQQHQQTMADRGANQLRQQQAYNWMEGGNQTNGLMSPDYANAGFNSISGQANPFAGPPAIDGVGMDWASGAYDPSKQTGTGSYIPAWWSQQGGK